jgi:hypothetical protein
MDTATDNAAALAAIKRRAHAVRLPVTKLCEQAGVAYSTVYRGEKKPEALSVGTLAKLEAKLDELEAARAAA